MPAKLRITITHGNQRGKEFIFGEHDTLLFVLLNDCQICLSNDTLVSRHHCILNVDSMKHLKTVLEGNVLELICMTAGKFRSAIRCCT
jgi:hypothetical protein